MSASAPSDDPEVLLVEYATLIETSAGRQGHGRCCLGAADQARGNLALTYQERSFRAPQLGRLTDLDARLRSLASRIIPVLRRKGEQWRKTVQPEKANWWWSLDKDEKSNPLWAVLPTVLFVVTISLFTDFARKLFTVELDAFGLSTVLLQALLTVAAGSAFTNAGREWLDSLLSRLHIPRHSYPLWKSGIGLLLAALVATGWIFLPSWLAIHYNDEAVNLTPTMNPSQVLAGIHPEGQNVDQAKKFFQRAINLDPDLPESHFNLGVLYEQTMEFDQAIREYQAATSGNSSKGRSTALKAYNNLARVLILHNKDANGALRLLDGVIQQGLTETEDAAPSIYKNRGWANLELGYYQDAEADLKTALTYKPNTAASYCLLAITYEKLAKTAEAQQSWQNFRRYYSPQDATQTPVEPECPRLAEVKAP